MDSIEQRCSPVTDYHLSERVDLLVVAVSGLGLLERKYPVDDWLEPVKGDRAVYCEKVGTTSSGDAAQRDDPSNDTAHNTQGSCPIRRTSSGKRSDQGNFSRTFGRFDRLLDGPRTTHLDH